ncbi:MAG: BrnT family toxin [Bacteroides sp.]|nr:BrnT family toxin [Eubacterium sp.]MCM1417552.1 BrnT family toxin [Roseburia sp.]MCM1461737.1 BrnT family toxin [Bacteroides sp.]
MQFEWDDEKNKENIRKHKLSFSTAKFVFNDENRVEIFDEGHSTDEERYLTIGLIEQVPIVATVIYTERGQKIRLISARKATAEERKMYYDGSRGIKPRR